MFSATSLLGGLMSNGLGRAARGMLGQGQQGQAGLGGLLGGGSSGQGDGLLEGIANAGGGNWGGTAAKVAGVAAVGGLGYMAYRHFKGRGDAPGGGAGPGDAGGGLGGFLGQQGGLGTAEQAGFGGGAADHGAAQAGFGGGGSPGFGTAEQAGFPGVSAPTAPAGLGGGGVGGGFGGGGFGSAQQAGFAGGAGPVGGAQGFGAQPPAPPAPTPMPANHPWAQFTSPHGVGAPAPPVAAAPVPAGPQPSAEQEEQALLLVRAMVAAASVDGQIDETERRNILQSLHRSGVGEAERQALLQELAAPRPPAALLAQVRDPDMARQFYLVTILAIDVDTPAETAYVKGLPPMLGLSPAVVAQIHEQLQIPLPA